jgi:cytochrome P450
MSYVFPPGPRPIPLVGDSLRYRRDRLRFLTECREQFGKAVTVHFGKVPVFLFNEPDTIRDILIKRSQEFVSRDAVQNVRFLLGDTLRPSNLFSNVIKACCGCMHEQAMLASDGAEHWEQRRGAHPGPSSAEVERFVGTMAAVTENSSAGWQCDRKLDLADELQGLSLRIVTKTLFDLELESEELKERFRYLVQYNVNPFGLLQQIPINLPFLPYGKYQRSWATIEKAIEIVLMRSGSEDATYAMGLRALLDPHEGPGGVFTKARIKHYVFQMLGMGHITTASALTFALGLLADHPEETAKIRQELRKEIGDEPLSSEGLKALPLLEMAILESLRLYPVIWGQARRAVKDVQVEDYFLPAGSFVILSSWVSHRSSEYFDQPDRFIPSRFAGSVNGGPRPTSYFPFGAGPHICIGERFALLEMKVVLATLLRLFEFRPVARYKLRAIARTLVLQPRDGLPMNITRLKQSHGLSGVIVPDTRKRLAVGF